MLANLEEQVELVASIQAPLPKREFIAILSGKRLVRSCSRSPCSEVESRERPGTNTYFALLYTRTKRLAPSAAVKVTWKKLSLQLSVTSAVPGTLQQSGSDGTQLSQLAGVPVTMSVSAPHGFASSWFFLQFVDLREQTLSEPCNPSPGCTGEFKVAGTAGTFAVRAANKNSTDLLWSRPVTIKPRNWQVAVHLPGDTNPPAPTVTLTIGDGTEVDALVTEPNAPLVSKYATVELLSRTGSANETIEQSCPGQYVCPKDETKTSESTVVYTARVLAADDQSKFFESGRSTPRAVSWHGSRDETFALKPGQTVTDQHFTSGSFGGIGHVDVSGVISVSNPGTNQTTCFDLEYYTTLQGQNASCSGPWPDHHPINASSALELGPPDCKDQTCGWKIGSYPSAHPFDPNHTYSGICIWGPCQEDPDGPYSPKGQLWFWALPFGVACNITPCQVYGGAFTVTVHYS